ncbi:MAG: glutamyl-tRNA reductase [Candidatus Thermoplasmatota archaeon]|nr:glutamyl-tRNA reductase [Candidatus Thermoplasmatota archaeon]
MMYVANLRVTHKTAPIEVIDRMILTESKKREICEALLAQNDIEESVVLQTCNRFELYISGKKEEEGKAQARKTMLDWFGPRISEHLVVDSYMETLEHLFRVSSSLESMIVGENQILGQVREALDYSSTNQFSGRVLEPLFQKAISIGRRVRNETKISQGKVSIASAAVDLANRQNPLENKKVLLVGTGNMASLVAEHLAGFGPKELVVVGRTPERLQEFCDVYSGQSRSFKELPTDLEDADVLFSATSCPRVLIPREMVENAVEEREESLTLVDIAMPADIDPTVRDIPGVQHFSIDDLQEISSQNQIARMDEAKKAESVIMEELGRFKGKLQGLHLDTFFSSLNKYVDGIRQKELEKALSKLGDVEPEVRSTVESLSKSLTKKIMHNFLTQVRSSPMAPVDMEKFVTIFMGRENVSQDPNETIEE